MQALAQLGVNNFPLFPYHRDLKLGMCVILYVHNINKDIFPCRPKATATDGGRLRMYDAVVVFLLIVNPLRANHKIYLKINRTCIAFRFEDPCGQLWLKFHRFHPKT
jgi:hypothetical protein